MLLFFKMSQIYCIHIVKVWNKPCTAVNYNYANYQTAIRIRISKNRQHNGEKKKVQKDKQRSENIHSL